MNEIKIYVVWSLGALIVINLFLIGNELREMNVVLREGNVEVLRVGNKIIDASHNKGYRY